MFTIQPPFTDADQGLESVVWSAAEDEMLLRGVAANETFEAIAEQISDELNARTMVACKRRFGQIRESLK